MSAVFTPVQASLGALLLHTSSSNLLANVGTVLGISSIVDGCAFGDRAAWRWATLGGMLVVPFALQIAASVTGASQVKALMTGDALGVWGRLSGHLGRVATAGLLVGFGSKLGSGCTSGHFLCGLSRLSKRSIVASFIFFPTAVITAVLLPFSPPIVPLNLAIPAYAPRLPAEMILFAIPIGLSAIAHTLLLPRANSAPAGSVGRLLPYIWAGATFSMGLILSGMADPAKVLGFLHLPGTPNWVPQWDTSLAMVFVFAVIPNGMFYRRYIQRFKEQARVEGKKVETQDKGKKSKAKVQQPTEAAIPSSEVKPRLSWATWNVPTRTDIDAKLVIGAVIFGVGWGLAGVCPGPALVGAASAAARTAVTGVPDGALQASLTFVACMLVGMFSARQI